MTNGFIEGFKSGLGVVRKRKKKKKSKLSERERKVLAALGDQYGL